VHVVRPLQSAAAAADAAAAAAAAVPQDAAKGAAAAGLISISTCTTTISCRPAVWIGSRVKLTRIH
jgi:hypothetical protein